MSEIEKKLNEMGHQLTEPRRSAVGNFVPAVRTGNLVYTAGTGPGLPDGGLLHVGKLGAEISIEQGYDCARLTMLNLLSNLKGEIGRPGQGETGGQAAVHGQCRAGVYPDPPGGQWGFRFAGRLVRGEGAPRPLCRGHEYLPGNMPIEIEMIVEVED